MRPFAAVVHDLRLPRASGVGEAPAMSMTPSTIEPARRDATVDDLEQAWRMPAVEPTRPASPTPVRRRAAVVLQATDAGFTPGDLVAVLLFVTFIAGSLALVAVDVFA